MKLVAWDVKGIHNRWYGTSTAFPVIVAEVTLEKQADL
jgi:hypothetical protein